MIFSCNLKAFFFEMKVHFRYCPIIPTVLVNGAEGIGTAWSTKVPCYNPREIVDNMRALINGREPKPLVRKIQGVNNYRETFSFTIILFLVVWLTVLLLSI